MDGCPMSQRLLLLITSDWNVKKSYILSFRSFVEVLISFRAQ
jgi:hypothetical protein